MIPIINPSGYILFPSEKSLYNFLEKPNGFLSKFRGVIPQYLFAPSCIIDYIARNKENKIILIEVKNWFIKIKDIQQIVKYLCHANEEYGYNNYRFILVAGGGKSRILEKLNVEIILTKDIYKGPTHKIIAKYNNTNKSIIYNYIRNHS